MFEFSFNVKPWYTYENAKYLSSTEVEIIIGGKYYLPKWDLADANIPKLISLTPLPRSQCGVRKMIIAHRKYNI
jgi:hypothetical protein